MSERQASRILLRQIADQAIASVKPSSTLPQAVRSAFHSPPKGRTLVLGAGKAAAQMAVAFEACYPWPFHGCVVTRYGFACETKTIEVLEASHPVPDVNGVNAAKRFIAELQHISEDDRVVFLLSGGGSALLCCPEEGLTLDDKRDATRQLLFAGASISEINTVRSALSAVKGGKLGAFSKAPITTFAISDVVGDDPSKIASGPTVPKAVSRARASEIIRAYRLEPSDNLSAFLKRNPSSQPATSRPHDDFVVIASARELIDRARQTAWDEKIEVFLLDLEAEGEAADVARTHAAEILSFSRPKERMLFLSAGELTVTMASENSEDVDGRGGPNQEYLLSLMRALGTTRRYTAMSIDTDGVDGSEDNAGAVCDEQSLERAQQLNLCPADHLSRHDSYAFFDALGDVVKTGPTGTNVNDLRMVLVEPMLQD